MKLLYRICNICGAVYINKTKGHICPACNNKYPFAPHEKLLKVYGALTNIRNYEYIVESVHVHHNFDARNSQLVIRFDDDYFNDWNSLELPAGFVILRPQDSGNIYPRPIEMVCSFDLSVTATNAMFDQALDNAVNALLDWVRKFPVPAH